MNKYIMQKLQVLLGPALIFLVWWLFSTFGSINTLFLPRINDTLQAFVSFILSGGLYDIWATLYKLLIGFVGASAVAIPLGLLFGLNQKLYNSFEIVIEFFRSLPVITLFPLFLLFFGIGDSAKIAMAFFVTFFVVLINTIHGVWHISKTKLRVGNIFRATNLEIVSKIVFFDSLPQIFIGLRTAFSLTLVVVIVTEMFIGTTHGLGQKVFDSYATYKIPELYSLILIIGLLGYILNKGFLLFERRIIHWGEKT